MVYYKRKKYASRPRRRVRRKSFRRRRTSRFKRYPRTAIQRWVNPLRQSANYKLTYAQSNFELDCSTAAGNKDYFYFKGNSMYDPYGTGVGFQPYGWDQLTPGLFQLYKVHAAKITVFATLVIPAESTCNSATVTIAGTIESAPTHDELTDMRRTGRAKSMCLSSHSKQTGKLSNYFTTKWAYPNMSGEFGLRAQYNSDPTYRWNIIVHGSSERQLQPAKIFFDVRIKYYITLSRNQGIGPS